MGMGMGFEERGKTFGFESTHTEACSSAGVKDQERALAAVHLPTAAVERAAQWSGAGVKGARQRALSTRDG